MATAKPSTSAWIPTSGRSRSETPLTLPCLADGCYVNAHDISSDNPEKQFSVCHTSPRDYISCGLYGLKDGKLIHFVFEGAPMNAEFQTSGNGLVLRKTEGATRLFERVHKYRLEGTTLTEVAQPFYMANTPVKLTIEHTFALLLDPDAQTLVGNARPNSDILVLGSHGSKPAFLLVRLSSGITGYVHFHNLMKASQHDKNQLGAG